MQLCRLNSYGIPQKRGEKRMKERGDEEKGEKKENKPITANKTASTGGSLFVCSEDVRKM